MKVLIADDEPLAVERLSRLVTQMGHEVIATAHHGQDVLNHIENDSPDVVLLDTAGRLHTKLDLMDELKKVHRVIKKVVPEAPHQVWLVVDGTIGQNSLQQAKEFQKALELTGLIVTKLDGTAKGGVVIGISDQFKIPVKYIGVGEGIEDLQVFNKYEFVDSFFK